MGVVNVTPREGRVLVDGRAYGTAPVEVAVSGGTHIVRASADGFEDLYGFVPEPVPPVDIEVSNWYTATYPRSPFVTGLIVCAQRADGGRTVLSDWDGLALTEQSPTETVVTPVDWDEVPGLLERRFGLDAPLE